VYDFLVGQLKDTGPFNKAAFMATLDYSLEENIGAYYYQDISAYFKNGFADIFAPGPMAVAEREGVMGRHDAPRMPLYIHKATHDEVSHIEDTDDLVKWMCKGGSNVLYVRNELGTHSEERYAGRPAAFVWLEAVLSGTYAAHYDVKGCKTVGVSLGLPVKRETAMAKMR
jgi:hypothetical protein